MGFLSRLFDDNAKDLKKYSKILQSVNALEPQMQKFSDAELAGETLRLRGMAEAGADYRQLLPEAFAVAREAAWRSLGMRHFDVQMLGGMALADGRIAEMRTGEGKTLVATAPAYLHALYGKGVHVITVNDYLATRDSQWMGQVYRFLGMDVGLIVHGMNHGEKKTAYAADITYGTNNEFGFDYLRDNMCFSKDAMVQRPLYYCIVDEVDSILIDEARTPLIISGPADKPADLYYTMAKLVPRLKESSPESVEEKAPDGDYTVDLKNRQAALTEAGVAKMEAALGIENLYDPKNSELSHHVNQALRARVLFRRDRDYVVKDGEVIIVDEFTGRLMFGRRYNQGLHQAIEAKEGVKIERESQTVATVTFQNYFRMYERLAGMTGTAKTEEEEFRKIYNFDVVEIPTNKPAQRTDDPDVIYRTEAGKFAAVVEEIVSAHATGRPVLVGTTSIEKSEVLSAMLKRRGVSHQVLNAKFHEMEAHIVAQAGRRGAVTIATNMAGRGTDIMLGGNPETMAADEISRMQAKDPEREISAEERQAIIGRYRQQVKAEHDEVVSLGGLLILGTERHDSRRIDNQLRGRAGRQGDPGLTRFYLSMEDTLMKRFGGNLTAIMDRIGMDDSVPIAANMVSRSIEQAQKRVEERNFDTRKTVLDYDDVMNTQRELIYQERRKALLEPDVHESVLDMIAKGTDAVMAEHMPGSEAEQGEWKPEHMLNAFAAYLPRTMLPAVSEVKGMSAEALGELLRERVFEAYEQKGERLGKDALNQLEHVVILKVVDRMWMDHLDAMDDLRQGIGLRSIGQLNPLIEYKREAFDMFQAMVTDIQKEVARLALTAEIMQRPEERKDLRSSHDGSAPQKKQPVRKAPDARVGRNDPCPCGSGKKYKNCCGKNA